MLTGHKNAVVVSTLVRCYLAIVTLWSMKPAQPRSLWGIPLPPKNLNAIRLISLSMHSEPQ